MRRQSLLLSMALTMSVVTACSQSETSNSPQDSANTVEQSAPAPVRKAEKPEEHSQEARVIASGTFSGRSEHITTGKVSIEFNDNKFQVILADDFSLDGAPDPVLGFGNGEFVKASNFSKLNSISGRQVYDLPSSIDPTIYTEIYVWCEQFSVPLGVAKLVALPSDEALDDTYGS